MLAFDKRAVAAGVLVVWAGVLIYDMQRLKESPQFKQANLGSGSVRVFGVSLGDVERKEE